MEVVSPKRIAPLRNQTSSLWFAVDFTGMMEAGQQDFNSRKRPQENLPRETLII
jgi:hypothetical protein